MAPIMNAPEKDLENFTARNKKDWREVSAVRAQ
jgi:hypothetical protein